MTAATVIRHPLARMAQRDFQMDDTDLIMLFGTLVADGFLVLNRDLKESHFCPSTLFVIRVQIGMRPGLGLARSFRPLVVIG